MNMSYCRFQNTYGDLCDCDDALYNEGLSSLSDTEKRYAKRMYELCKEFIEHYEEEAGIEEEDED